MDYKFLVSATQDSAGSENAKIKIEVEGAVAVASAEIASTDTDNPTGTLFEVTGLDATGSSTTIDVKYTLLNDYYVDADTDRNARIHQFHYHDKTNGSEYQRPEGHNDVVSLVTTTSFVYANMDGAEMTAITAMFFCCLCHWQSRWHCHLGMLCLQLHQSMVAVWHHLLV